MLISLREVLSVLLRKAILSPALMFVNGMEISLLTVQYVPEDNPFPL